MPVVELAQHWVDELTELHAEPTAVNLGDVVDAALKQYVFRQRQEKIARERRWYEMQHRELVQTYDGRYIAIHNGQVIDSDVDGTVLAKRVRQEHGRAAIAIIEVTATPELPTLHIRSPKVA